VHFVHNVEQIKMADNKSIEKQEITRKLYSRGRSSGTYKFTDAK
jgi:membrane protease subunit (stomatin/prohibitin family)